MVALVLESDESYLRRPCSCLLLGVLPTLFVVVGVSAGGMLDLLRHFFLIKAFEMR